MHWLVVLGNNNKYPSICRALSQVIFVGSLLFALCVAFTHLPFARALHYFIGKPPKKRPAVEHLSLVHTSVSCFCFPKKQRNLFLFGEKHGAPGFCFLFLSMNARLFLCPGGRKQAGNMEETRIEKVSTSRGKKHEKHGTRAAIARTLRVRLLLLLVCLQQQYNLRCESWQIKLNMLWFRTIRNFCWLNRWFKGLSAWGTVHRLNSVIKC